MYKISSYICFQERLSLTGSYNVPNVRSCVFRVNNEVEQSRALNTIIFFCKILHNELQVRFLKNVLFQMHPYLEISNVK